MTLWHRSLTNRWTNVESPQTRPRDAKMPRVSREPPRARIEGRLPRHRRPHRRRPSSPTIAHHHRFQRRGHARGERAVELKDALRRVRARVDDEDVGVPSSRLIRAGFLASSDRGAHVSTTRGRAVVCTKRVVRPRRRRRRRRDRASDSAVQMRARLTERTRPDARATVAARRRDARDERAAVQLGG